MLFFSLGLFAQVPQGFNYQAVVRNDAGEVIKNQEIKVKIGILQGVDAATLVWEEEHTVVTNNLGLVSLMVGDPDALNTGGTLTSFEDIDWSAGDYYLQVSVDPGDGTGYVQMGEARLLSVPYALYAGKADGVGWSKEGDTLTFPGNIGVGTDKVAGTKLAVQGDDVASEAPLFEVKRKDGQTVFAVYNDSIRMYVNGASSSKGPRRGGFAIGGFGMTKGEPQPLMWISPDSARIYYEQTDKKGPHRGGFAIGGFDMGKKGPSTQLMQLTKENYFIGHQSGEKITSGLYNQFFGYQAGMNTTTGANNIFMGYMSGYSTVGAYENIFIGKESGYSNVDGYGNVYIGNQSGHENKSGYFNSFIGYRSGYSTNSNYNSFFGYRTGRSNTSGSWNTFLGFQAGYNNISGNYNTYVGPNTGFYNKQGSNNSYIGYYAGFRNVSGSNNTYIGNRAGYSGDDASASNNIFIGVRAGYKNLAGELNVFIGNTAGYSSTNGIANVVIGDSAAYNLTTGDYNIAVGPDAGFDLNTGNYNTFMGYQAGYNAGGSSFSTSIGYKAGFALSNWQAGTYVGFEAGVRSTGRQNVFLGASTGNAFTTGADNVAVGAGAGGSNNYPFVEATGSKNVLIGYYAGYKCAGAGHNVIVGAQDPFSSNLITGSENVYLGENAGNKSGNASGNIFIGYQAGIAETGSNKLIIENNYAGTDNAGNALIYGDFENDLLRLNANVGAGGYGAYNYYGLVVQGGTSNSLKVYSQTGQSGDALYVSGDAYITGDVTVGGTVSSSSDLRFKKNIHEIDNSLTKVLRLKGVNFDWKTDGELAQYKQYFMNEDQKDFSFNFSRITSIAFSISAHAPVCLGKSYVGWQKAF